MDAFVQGIGIAVLKVSAAAPFDQQRVTGKNPVAATNFFPAWRGQEKEVGHAECESGALCRTDQPIGTDDGDAEQSFWPTLKTYPYTDDQPDFDKSSFLEWSRVSRCHGK